MRLTTDLFQYCHERVPRWNTISISGYHFREKGCSAVQEVAFTLSSGIAYVQAAIDKGLNVDEFAPRLSFFFNAHLDFFEEIAKYRAARRIWARELRERYGAKNPRSWLMRFHTQTAGVSLTAQQPLNNIVRTAIEGLPPRQRAVIELRDVAGCDGQETCAALQVSEANQRVLLHRARAGAHVLDLVRRALHRKADVGHLLAHAGGGLGDLHLRLGRRVLRLDDLLLGAEGLDLLAQLLLGIGQLRLLGLELGDLLVEPLQLGLGHVLALERGPRELLVPGRERLARLGVELDDRLLELLGLHLQTLLRGDDVRDALLDVLEQLDLLLVAVLERLGRILGAIEEL